MEKIGTIFDRDWDGHHGVIPRLLINPGGAIATEKLDGTNVRLTVRAHTLVRVEARQNPTKQQKEAGIVDPWYRDAWSINYRLPEPVDQHLVAAAQCTSLVGVPDGDWAAEAVGPKIQGNPLGLEVAQCFFFSLNELPEEVCVPVIALPFVAPAPDGDAEEADWFFERLGTWFREEARSALNPEVPPEGIVWQDSASGFGGKIKAKDFKGVQVS